MHTYSDLMPAGLGLYVPDDVTALRNPRLWLLECWRRKGELIWSFFTFGFYGCWWEIAPPISPPGLNKSRGNKHHST